MLVPPPSLLRAPVKLSSCPLKLARTLMVLMHLMAPCAPWPTCSQAELGRQREAQQEEETEHEQKMAEAVWSEGVRQRCEESLRYNEELSCTHHQAEDTWYSERQQRREEGVRGAGEGLARGYQNETGGDTEQKRTIEIQRQIQEARISEGLPLLEFPVLEEHPKKSSRGSERPRFEHCLVPMSCPVSMNRILSFHCRLSDQMVHRLLASLSSA